MAATTPFVGRSRLLERARQVVAGGLHLHLVGEAGTGKTTLARRVAAGAIYVEHPSPPSEVLATLLLHAYGRGWWTPARGASSEGAARSSSKEHDEEEEEEDLDEGTLVKLIRKMGVKAASEAAVAAYRVPDPKPTIIFDSFEQAPAGVVRLVRALGDVAIIVAVSGETLKAHQKPFVFGCQRVEVKRLTPRETQELVEKLLAPYDLRASERARLVRHIVEEAQGLPAVVQELLKRARARGELSLAGVRKEGEVNGHRTVDMTPGLGLVFAALMIGRGFSYGWGDHDLRIAFAGVGGLMMVARFFLFRASPARRR